MDFFYKQFKSKLKKCFFFWKGGGGGAVGVGGYSK